MEFNSPAVMVYLSYVVLGALDYVEMFRRK